MHRNMFGKVTSRQLRLSPVEMAILGGMILVLLMTSVDALEGSQVGKGNALELARKQGHQEFIAQRAEK